MIKLGLAVIENYTYSSRWVLSPDEEIEKQGNAEDNSWV